jgi:hypothetical protein
MDERRQTEREKTFMCSSNFCFKSVAEDPNGKFTMKRQFLASAMHPFKRNLDPLEKRSNAERERNK